MRNNNFDFLRFLLAFIVIIGHIVRISHVTALQPLVIFPVFTGFFCISGFLITISYNRTDNLFLFFKKRIRRILPAYLLVVITCAIGLSLVSSYSFQEYFKNPQFFKYLLANLTFLNFVEPCLPGVFASNVMCAVNGALWTIKIEIMFYLLIPIIMFFLNRIRQKHILLLGVYIFAVVYRNILLHAEGNYTVMLARQLPGMLSYFACGIALYYYFNFFKKYKNIFFIIGLLLFILERIYSHYEIFTPFATSAIIYYIAFSFNWLNKFGKYGDISYGIYIFHFPIIQLAVFWGLFEQYNPFLVVLCIIILILLIGFLSWNLIEKPFLNRVKHVSS
jgi:peptidoglycan/LPS O-acetylase OafA/YrhL